MRTRLVVLLILSMLIYSCQQDTSLDDEIPQSSWEVIQTEILEPNCVACHTAGTTFAAQSELVLTKEEGYDQLVNRLPSNEAARNDGLELVGTKVGRIGPARTTADAVFESECSDG